MSIERAIHERFRSWKPLVDLVPPARFTTGPLPVQVAGSTPGEVPYVTLECGPQRSAERMSGGRTLVTTTVRFSVHASSLAVAWEIAAEVHRRFERQSFSDRETLVQDMKRQSFQKSPRSAGAWQIVLEYLTRVEE